MPSFESLYLLVSVTDSVRVPRVILRDAYGSARVTFDLIAGVTGIVWVGRGGVNVAAMCSVHCFILLFASKNIAPYRLEPIGCRFRLTLPVPTLAFVRRQRVVTRP
jgi:hypothetical protein